MPDVLSRPRTLTSKLTGQFARYLIVGGTVAVVYLGGAYALQAAGVPVWIAIGVAYGAGVTLHFVAQRGFVFRGTTFHLTVREQLVRYVAVGSAQLAITYGGTALLAVFGVDHYVAFVITTVVATASLFTALRLAVFHSPPR